ncbi:unnamed protein product [Polarella glacialis]|uniref:Uncharacterized protein n=2 Tax=Polarella glacialis TaxID=89957 RepID=A0A813DUW2_POLGL|nr:unnamed protein product [Polarella glacialis]
MGRGPGTGRRTSRATGRLLALAATAAAAAFVGSAGAAFGAALGRSGCRAATSVAMRADLGVSIGHILQMDNGTSKWVLTNNSLPILDENEDAMAQLSWKAFSTQYSGAAERGVYFDTPVTEEDVKYRWRRMRNSFDVSSEKALEIVNVDALPMVIDADYVQATFEAMAAGATKEKAIEIISRHPGILAAGKEVGNNMVQADIASTVIKGAREFANIFKGKD